MRITDILKAHAGDRAVPRQEPLFQGRNAVVNGVNRCCESIAVQWHALGHAGARRAVSDLIPRGSSHHTCARDAATRRMRTAQLPLSAPARVVPAHYSPLATPWTSGLLVRKLY